VVLVGEGEANEEQRINQSIRGTAELLSCRDAVMAATIFN
jgi:hypothetical protein